MPNIITQIEKKEESLQKLYNKRSDVNKKLNSINKEITEQEKELKNLKNEKAAREMDEIKIVLKENNISLTEVMNAIKNGDLNKIITNCNNYKNDESGGK